MIGTRQDLEVPLAGSLAPVVGLADGEAILWLDRQHHLRWIPQAEQAIGSVDPEINEAIGGIRHPGVLDEAGLARHIVGRPPQAETLRGLLQISPYLLDDHPVKGDPARLSHPGVAHPPWRRRPAA